MSYFTEAELYWIVAEEFSQTAEIPPPDQAWRDLLELISTSSAS